MTCIYRGGWVHYVGSTTIWFIDWLSLIDKFPLSIEWALYLLSNINDKRRVLYVIRYDNYFQWNNKWKQHYNDCYLNSIKSSIQFYFLGFGWIIQYTEEFLIYCHFIWSPTSCLLEQQHSQFGKLFISYSQQQFLCSCLNWVVYLDVKVQVYFTIFLLSRGVSSLVLG